MMKFNPWFFLPFLVLLAAGGILLATIERGQDVLFINGFHSPALDCLFYYGTALGNGLLYVFFGIALAWKNFRASALALICFAATGLLTQFLKKAVFTDVMRPSVVLAGENLHFIEGVKMLSHHSFPSGHSATAFSLFCLLALMVREKKWGIVFLSMALIGGISRIYLAQHFFIDVYFGAILGVAVTSLIWWRFEKTHALQQLSGKSISAYFHS